MKSGRFRLPQLIWPVVVTSVILLAVGVSGAWYVFQLQAAASDILAWNVTSIRAAEELEIVIREIRYHLNRFELSGDAKELAEIPKLLSTCEFWMDESRRLARSDDERHVIAQLDEGYQLFKSELAQLQKPPTIQARREYVNRLVNVTLKDRILSHAKDYLDFNERELAASSEQNQMLAERLALGLLVIGVCGAAAGLLAGYGLARGISKRIVKISLPIHDVAGQLSDVVGPVSISDVRELEDLDQVLQTIAGQVSTVVERLRRTEREALRTEQLAALGQLAAGLAHELRNPLMSMKILVQSAQSDERESLGGHDLDVLDDEIVRLEKLVSTFLEFARPSEPTKRLTDIVEILRSTCELTARQARIVNVTVHFIPPVQATLVEADPAQLRQVFLNLLLNALDAVQAGGDIWLDVSRVAEADGDRNSVCVTVSDNGSGLPEHLKQSMFDPFVSTKTTGIGLGLTICRHIIKAHGGEISASDREGGGAVFEVRLPDQQKTRAEADALLQAGSEAS